jgi:hypothetical protein
MKRDDEAFMFYFDIVPLRHMKIRRGSNLQIFSKYLCSQYMMWINVFSIFSSILP